MNTLILVTADNLAGIENIVPAIAQSQKSKNLGKLLIVGSIYLEDDKLREFAEVLEDCFEVVEINKAQVSLKLPHETKLATMISTFLMQKYTTVPGPWLIIDGDAEVTLPNPLTTLEKAHNANTKENSGRAFSPKAGGRIPMGPVVLGADFRKIKSLKSISGEDWRQRGRFTFGLCSWYQATSDEYPFRLPDINEVPARTSELPEITEAFNEETLKEKQKELKASKKSLSTLPEGGRSEKEQYSSLAGMKPVALDGPPKPEVEPTQEPKPEPAPAFKASVPLPFVRMDPTHYLKASKSELSDQIEKRAGKRPHHATGIKKLVATLVNLDKAPVLK